MASALPVGDLGPSGTVQGKLRAREMQTALPAGRGGQCAHFRRMTPHDGTGVPPSEGAQASAAGAVSTAALPLSFTANPRAEKNIHQEEKLPAGSTFSWTVCFWGFVVVLALHGTAQAPSAILRPSHSRMEGEIPPRGVWALSVVTLPVKDDAEGLVLEYSDRQSHAHFTLLLERAAGPGPAPRLVPGALTWHAAGPLLAAASRGRLRSLGIALVKLPLEYAQEAGDPVVQPHVENELESRVETGTDS